METRGPKVGICNICGGHGNLTEDHTPPKGCIKPTQVDIQHISALLSAEPVPTRGRRSQNGVKYRTLCGRCNNSLLGATYDPAFISFVNGISAGLKTSYRLDHSMSILGQPQMILRSLLGHLCAQGVDRYKKGPMTEKIRDYLLDSTLPFPEELHAYYWTYPYRTHVMTRDGALLDIPTSQTYHFWLLKFFPVAFMIAWEPPQHLPFHVQSFDPWRSAGLADQFYMPLVLKPPPHQFWPEAPSDRTVLVFGKEAISVK